VNFAALPLRAGGLVRCVVECPRGSRVKLKYDPTLEVFSISRPLIQGLSFPFDWGFLPSTRGLDGDPLDAMLLHDEPTFPGLVVTGRLTAVLEARSEGRRNDRYFVTPAPVRREVKLTGRLKAELEQFFHAAVALEDKRLRLLRWSGPRRAAQLLAEGSED
jgi:inorganic pyrophosphatase